MAFVSFPAISPALVAHQPELSPSASPPRLQYLCRHPGRWRPAPLRGQMLPRLSLVIYFLIASAFSAVSVPDEEIKQAVFQISAPSSSITPTTSHPCAGTAVVATSVSYNEAFVPSSTAISMNIDPRTPSSDKKRTSKQGLSYELIWSEEFVAEGREFGFNDDHSDCDDLKWERTRPELARYWELDDLTEEEWTTLEELNPEVASDGLHYVYLYGDGDIADAASRATGCEAGDDEVGEAEAAEAKLSIAPPPSEVVLPAEGGPPAVILLRPYAAGWSVFAPLNNRGGRQLIVTREPICVPLGGFIEVGVVATGIPNVPPSVRRVIFWPGQPRTSLDKYSWKLINDSVTGWDFNSDVILDFDTGEPPSMEVPDTELTGFLPYQFTDTQITLGLPTETGDVDYVRVYAPAYVRNRNVQTLAGCDEEATGRPAAEEYIVIDLAHVRGL